MTALDWRCHTPNVLKEVLTNRGSEALRTPIAILGQLLFDVATRASELNDPALNLLMLRLALYSAGDPDVHSASDIDAVFAEQTKRLEKMS